MPFSLVPVPFFPSFTTFFTITVYATNPLESNLTLYWAQDACCKTTLFSNIRHFCQSVRPEQGVATKPRTKHVLSNVFWSQSFERQLVFSKRIQQEQTWLTSHPEIVLFQVVTSRFILLRLRFPRCNSGCRSFLASPEDVCVTSLLTSLSFEGKHGISSTELSQMEVVWCLLGSGSGTNEPECTVHACRIICFPFLCPLPLIHCPGFTGWQEVCLGLPKAGRLGQLFTGVSSSV